MTPRLFLPAMCLVSLHVVSPAAILRVPSGYPKIQAAILAASSGDTVLVDRGTYFENLNFRGKKIIVASRFILTKNPVDIEETVVNGGAPASPDTASCVLIVSGEDSTASLEGFTLTGGTGTKWTDEHGAGVFVEGGGILIQYSSPTIRHNRIIYNEAIRKPAGVRSAGGGGIRVGDGFPRILDNIIMSNHGMYGGGIVLNYTGAVVRNNIIALNRVDQAVEATETFGGGGIWAFSNLGVAPKIIENNTIVDNASSGSGSAQAGKGGGVIIGETTVELRNNIIWNNHQSTGTDLSVSSTVEADAAYNDIAGGYAGVGNFDLDPLFGGPEYHLGSGSPCVDAGDSSSTYADPEDPHAPGLAQSYSLETLRDDMGAFGGPGRRPETFTIAISSAAHGGIAPSQGTPVPIESIDAASGSDQTFLITPDSGYAVRDVLVNSISVGSVQSYTATNVRSAGTIGASFLRVYTIKAAAHGHGVLLPSGEILAGEGSDTRFTITPDHGYVIDSLVVDGFLTGAAPSYAFMSVSSDHSIEVAFKLDSAYLESYRTFRPDSIAFDRDNNGKAGKYVRLKPDRLKFAFRLQAPASSSLSLKFSMKTSGAIARGSAGGDTVMTWFDLSAITTTSPIEAGTWLRISGTGRKGKPLSAKYAWATTTATLRGSVADTSYSLNIPLLPMPNRINVLYELFRRNAFGSGLEVGLPAPDSPKVYGWVSAPKYTDALKSLYDKNVGLHTGNPGNFNRFISGKPVLGRNKSLSPAKYNNRLFADALVLKLNIAASAQHVTPPGLGSLLYDDGAENPLNGKSLASIAEIADSMLSARAYEGRLRSKSGYEASVRYANLDSVIDRINSAFEGPVDTTDLGFSGSLSLKGTRRLIDIPQLRSGPANPPVNERPFFSSQPPLADEYTLEQNYPNPFNPTTTISFSLPRAAIVTLTIFNVLGQEVRRPFDRTALDEGETNVLFDARSLASGVYVYRLTAIEPADAVERTGSHHTFTATRKMLLLR